MKRTFIVMLLCGSAMSAVATEADRINSDTQEIAAVLDELSQRSGLPELELNSLLADCSANQQSMYFCAWRDKIAADRALERF